MKAELINSYKENGYLVIKGLLRPQLLDQQLKNIYILLLRFHKPDKKLKKMDQPWNSLSFHQEVIKFREKDPKSFSGFYDCLQSSLSLTRLVTSNKLVECVAGLLELDACELSSVGQECRVDVPNDTRNLAGWHQDFPYFNHNLLGLKTMACWCPLVKLTSKSGYLQVFKKSHLEGMVSSGVTEKWDKPRDLNDGDNLATQTVPIKEDASLDQHKIESVKIDLGDVLFFNMFLIHRSGINTSNKIRFSVQNRFHAATSKDFVPYRFIPRRNPFVKESVIKSNAIPESIEATLS